MIGSIGEMGRMKYGIIFDSASKPKSHRTGWTGGIENGKGSASGFEIELATSD